jgi:hypothetical protein
MVLPRTAGQSGVVMELKSADTEAGETVERAFTAAFRQLRERDYAAELRERGADPIFQMAAVFAGKRVYVRVAPEKRAPRGATPKRKATPGKTSPKRKSAPGKTSPKRKSAPGKTSPKR